MCTEQAFSFSYPIKNGYDNYFLIFSLNGVHLLGTHGKKKIRVVPSEKKAVGLRGKYTIEVGHLVNTYTDGETALQLFLGQPSALSQAGFADIGVSFVTPFLSCRVPFENASCASLLSLLVRVIPTQAKNFCRGFPRHLYFSIPCYPVSSHF